MPGIQTESELSLSELIAKSRIQLREIRTCQKTLEKTCDWLEELDEIWPDQCRAMLDSVLELHEPINKLADMFKDCEDLPEEMSLSRYPILAKLNATDKELEEAKQIFHRLQAKSRTGLRLSLSQRSEIETKLEIFLQNTRGILWNINELLDPIRFQQ
jgi:hypothetical protein